MVKAVRTDEQREHHRQGTMRRIARDRREKENDPYVTAIRFTRKGVPFEVRVYEHSRE